MRSEYEETLMKQRALFDEEIVTLTEEMREEAKVSIHLFSVSPILPIVYLTDNLLRQYKPQSY